MDGRRRRLRSPGTESGVQVDSSVAPRSHQGRASLRGWCPRGAVALGAASILLLAVAAFALGACEVVVSNAAQMVLPDIVHATELHRANGQLFAATTTARTFVGAPLGSLLFAAAAALPFGLDAASFAVPAVLLARLPRRPRPPTAAPFGKAVVEGLRWLGGHRLTASAVGGIAGGMFDHRIAARIGTLPMVRLALAGAVPAYLAAGLSINGYIPLPARVLAAERMIAAADVPETSASPSATGLQISVW